MNTREIKFRLWSDSLKVMYSPDNQIGRLWSIPEADNGIIRVDKNDVLMQFTGLLDRNGKEIFEGDIVVYNDIKSTVVWYWYQWIFETADNQMATLQSHSDVEIIGNIYENPELL